MYSDSPLEKALGKQVKKQIDALKSLNLSNEIDELNQTERSLHKIRFPQNMIWFLIS